MDKRRSPDWSELPPELLELVVTKLCFIDVLRFKGVCRSFRRAAKVRSSITPLLMHQSTTYCGDYFHRKFVKTVQFLSPQDMNVVIYSPQGEKNCPERLLDNGCCVGSSHGWLVVLDKKANPFLLNPFSGAEIELPKKETLPGIVDEGYRHITVDYDGCVIKMLGATERILGKWAVPGIQKAILTANPSCAEDYKVLVICGCINPMGGMGMKIALWCRGDTTWRSLSSADEFYDVAFHNGRLYSIQRDSAPHPVYVPKRIHTWDLSSTLEVPQECGSISISDFVKPVPNKFDHCFVSHYLVSSSSSEDLFFVFRFMDSNPDVPGDIRTVGFEIYKLEVENGKEFVRMESLPGQAMFLGGNHGIVSSVQEDGNRLSENSIYFTSNYRDTFLNCFNYEIGIFSLENKSVNLICGWQNNPQPFWVFPGQK